VTQIKYYVHASDQQDSSGHVTVNKSEFSYNKDETSPNVIK